MKLLVLNPTGSIGGAERVLLAAVRGVLRERPRATVRVLLLGEGPLAAAAEGLGAEVEVVPMPAALSRLGDSQARGRGWAGRAALAAKAVRGAAAGVSLARRLRAAVRRFAPDLVHSHGIKTHLLSRFAVPGPVPVVWHAHDFYGLRPASAGLLRRASGRVRAVVAISDAVANDVRTVLPSVPVSTVMNAVDLSRFTPGPSDGTGLDRLAGIPPAPPGTVRVGLVATYARWKGHVAVLDAAAALAKSAPDLPVRWYLVGGPIYQTAAQFTAAELRDAAAARGVADRVGFVPFQADPADVYRALDVVVHASTLPEPFGLTVAEAMACGRPVVVSAAGGAAELFTDGVDALGAPPADAPRLAAGVEALASDPALRTRIGDAARKSAEMRFDETRYGRQLLAVYETVCPQLKSDADRRTNTSPNPTRSR